MSDCFVEDFMSEFLTDDRVIKYCDYLVNNYIFEDSTFTPSLLGYLIQRVYCLRQMRVSNFIRSLKNLTIFILALKLY